MKRFCMIAMVALIGFSTSSCDKDEAGTISYDIDPALQYLWTGADYKNGEPVGGNYNKTIQFGADFVNGSSDVAFEINVMLKEMAKKGRCGKSMHPRR